MGMTECTHLLVDLGATFRVDLVPFKIGIVAATDEVVAYWLRAVPLVLCQPP